jgi:hypothetical protein
MLQIYYVVILILVKDLSLLFSNMQLLKGDYAGDVKHSCTIVILKRLESRWMLNVGT